jgi:aspartate aminotransferase-like enzyme
MIVVEAGKFGERWGKILKAYGCNGIEVKTEWGRAVTVQQVQQAIADNPTVRAVYVQASETSTGVAHPVAAIAALCRNRDDTLCVVDGITAVGVFDVALDRDGIDVLVSGSQKAFMLPPGLAFVAISEKAWRFADTSDLPKFYLSFKAERKALRENSSAYTSSVSLVAGLQESLRMMKQEGLSEIFARHARLAAAARKGAEALGCPMYAATPSNGVTAVCAPTGVDSQKLVARLRDRYNMTIAGGQDQAKGKIFRVAHMGYFDDLDMVTLYGAIEAALADLGYAVKRGAGVAAVEEVLF